VKIETLTVPLLNWSPSALAALQYKGQREAMTRLFDAYFRVAEARDLTGTVLHLDLPTESKLDSILPTHVGVAVPSVRLKRRVPPAQPDQRHHFFARFTKNNGWVVYAALKREYRIMSKEVEGKFGLSDYNR
jgi:hypothetical protein